MAKAKRGERRPVHYALSTHWDREWYQSFQNYRARLVRLMDNILAGLADGRLAGPFQMDGQAILLEDYLEIRPERRDEVAEHVKTRRFVVGPWYVLPDEFIVCGESIVRNIRLGRSIAREWGAEPSNAGFVCDLFGHVGQLPQILKQFGIENAFVWRGINLDTKRHLIWEGVDGTETVCYKFANVGYCDYAFKVREAIRRELRFDHDRIMDNLKNYIAFEASESETGAVLLFDGGDHQEWDPEVYAVLQELAKKGLPGFDLKHTDLDAYVADMMKDRAKIKTRLKGELRESGRTPGKGSHQIHGVISSRVWIKQANAHCETLLLHEAEPASAFGELVIDEPSARGYLDVAWRWLIKNHPHDSICGCSIDEVHEDMKYRFAQAEQIGEIVTHDTLMKVAASVPGELEENEVRVHVSNPHASDFAGVTSVDLELPTTDYPMFGEFFGFEKLPVFTVHGSDGKEIPYQRVKQAMNVTVNETRYTKFPQPVKRHRVRVSLPLRIPALGYTTLKVKPGTSLEPTRHSQVPSLVTGDRRIENEFLAVEAGPGGTLTLTDKKTGEVYGDLLTLENRADIGDGWFHGEALNDEVQLSTGCHADIALIESGRYSAAFRVRTVMKVPAEFDFSSMTRSERRVDLTVDTVVRIRQGQRHVEFETTVDNNALDHRVRVFFPTLCNAKTYLADSAFDVVERPIALPADNHERFELSVETAPQQTWSAIFDRNRGLAVASSGQLESAARDNGDRTLALTLFRGTRRTVNTDGQPEGQLQKKMTFRYAIRPLKGRPDYAEMFGLGRFVASGLRANCLGPVEIELHRQKKSVPAMAGFLKVTGAAVLASCRMVDGGLEVRVFNPTTRKGAAMIDWSAAPKGMRGLKSAVKVDFESKAVGKKTKVTGKEWKFELGAKEIVTWRLE